MTVTPRHALQRTATAVTTCAADRRQAFRPTAQAAPASAVAELGDVLLDRASGDKLDLTVKLQLVRDGGGQSEFQIG